MIGEVHSTDRTIPQIDVAESNTDGNRCHKAVVPIGIRGRKLAPHGINIQCSPFLPTKVHGRVTDPDGISQASVALHIIKSGHKLLTQPKVHIGRKTLVPIGIRTNIDLSELLALAKVRMSTIL